MDLCSCSSQFVGNVLQGHDGMCNQTSVEAWEEQRKISKYAETLEQIPCTRKIPMNPEEVGLLLFFAICITCDLIPSM